MNDHFFVKSAQIINQSYKSILCFLTCWLIIPLLGESFKVTPLGIVSGLFWVPGATAGIYGIRNAGLAISVGTWSSIMVITSFCWGVFIFHEKVKTVSGAIGAALILIVGLIGMSVYSAPTAKKDTDEILPLLSQGSSLSDKDGFVGDVDKSANNGIEMTKANTLGVENNFNTVPKFAVVTRRKKMEDANITQSSKTLSTQENPVEKEDEHLFLGGNIGLSRRQLGIVGAIINGVWGGNNMIPLHYARYSRKIDCQEFCLCKCVLIILTHSVSFFFVNLENKVSLVQVISLAILVDL